MAAPAKVVASPPPRPPAIGNGEEKRGIKPFSVTDEINSVESVAQRVIREEPTELHLSVHIGLNSSAEFAELIETVKPWLLSLTNSAFGSEPALQFTQQLLLHPRELVHNREWMRTIRFLMVKRQNGSAWVNLVIALLANNLLKYLVIADCKFESERDAELLGRMIHRSPTLKYLRFASATGYGVNEAWTDTFLEAVGGAEGSKPSPLTAIEIITNRRPLAQSSWMALSRMTSTVFFGWTHKLSAPEITSQLAKTLTGAWPRLRWIAFSFPAIRVTAAAAAAAAATAGTGSPDAASEFYQLILKRPLVSDLRVVSWSAPVPLTGNLPNNIAVNAEEDPFLYLLLTEERNARVRPDFKNTSELAVKLECSTTVMPPIRIYQQGRSVRALDLPPNGISGLSQQMKTGLLHYWAVPFRNAHLSTENQMLLRQILWRFGHRTTAAPTEAQLFRAAQLLSLPASVKRPPARDRPNGNEMVPGQAINSFFMRTGVQSARASVHVVQRIDAADQKLGIDDVKEAFDARVHSDGEAKARLELLGAGEFGSAFLVTFRNSISVVKAQRVATPDVVLQGNLPVFWMSSVAEVASLRALKSVPNVPLLHESETSLSPHGISLIGMEVIPDANAANLEVLLQMPLSDGAVQVIAQSVAAALRSIHSKVVHNDAHGRNIKFCFAHCYQPHMTEQVPDCFLGDSKAVLLDFGMSTNKKFDAGAFGEYLRHQRRDWPLLQCIVSGSIGDYIRVAQTFAFSDRVHGRDDASVNSWTSMFMARAVIGLRMHAKDEKSATILTNLYALIKTEAKLRGLTVESMCDKLFMARFRVLNSTRELAFLSESHPPVPNRNHVDITVISSPLPTLQRNSRDDSEGKLHLVLQADSDAVLEQKERMWRMASSVLTPIDSAEMKTFERLVASTVAQPVPYIYVAQGGHRVYNFNLLPPFEAVDYNNPPAVRPSERPGGAAWAVPPDEKTKSTTGHGRYLAMQSANANLAFVHHLASGNLYLEPLTAYGCYCAEVRALLALVSVPGFEELAADPVTGQNVGTLRTVQSRHLKGARVLLLSQVLANRAATGRPFSDVEQEVLGNNLVQRIQVMHGFGIIHMALEVPFIWVTDRLDVMISGFQYSTTTALALYVQFGNAQKKFSPAHPSMMQCDYIRLASSLTNAKLNKAADRVLRAMPPSMTGTQMMAWHKQTQPGIAFDPVIRFAELIQTEEQSYPLNDVTGDLYNNARDAQMIFRHAMFNYELDARRKLLDARQKAEALAKPTPVPQRPAAAAAAAAAAEGLTPPPPVLVANEPGGGGLAQPAPRPAAAAAAAALDTPALTVGLGLGSSYTS
jgi:hypothetical protein